jgi:hypothetical protein
MIPLRTEYGFTRTVCACDDCKRYCSHLSGMVVPQDLQRWEALYGPAVWAQWRLTHLAASPGAAGLIGGKIERIRTIVPARLASGRCQWLRADETCGIHNEAPYGCAFFDCQQTQTEGDERSMQALAGILYDWAIQGPYSQLWRLLDAAGKRVAAPEVSRAHMRGA